MKHVLKIMLITASTDTRISFFENSHGNVLSRLTLQKRIMTLLRKIEHCVHGVQPAWEETFRNWEVSSKVLQTFPKLKTEDAQAEMFHRGMGKRRASHQSSEHDLEEQINEWANMTWFLLALGGVCLQKRNSSRQMLLQQSHNNSSVASLAQASLYSSSTSSGHGSLHPSTVSLSTIPPAPPQDVSYCPVTQYVYNGNTYHCIF